MSEENLLEKALAIMSPDETQTVLRKAIEIMRKSLKCETCNAEGCLHDKKDCDSVILAGLMQQAGIIDTIRQEREAQRRVNEKNRERGRF